MTAPKIFVVVGWNVDEGRLVAWYFDEGDARAHRDRENAKHGDEWAFRVEECESGDPMPKRSRS